VALLLFAAPVSAQSRDEDERNRSQQTREADERQDQSSRSQTRERDQTSRDQSQYRDQSPYRDQSQSRDQSQYREQRGQTQYRDQQYRNQDSSEQDAGLGITLRESQDGVQIQQIFTESPAQQAGLRRGDYLLSIDDDRVRSVQDVERMIREKEPGSWVDLEVWRNGQRQTIEARLASRQRAFGSEQGGQFGFRSGQQQPGMTTRPQQPRFPDWGQQDLAQQVQNLQRQLAQLRQEVDQLRNERQALRPTFDERGRSQDSQRQLDSQRQFDNQRQFDSQRQSDRNLDQQRSSDRSQRNSDRDD
jgi:C-terminal processing protease CtpA/Prc